MTVRNSVLVKMTGVCLATVGTIFGLNYLFGNWGLIIFWSSIIVYMLYILFQMQVDTETRKRQDLVDKLKE